MTKVYLIRHGESVNNIKDRFGEDTELTEEGERQAREIAEYLKGIKFDIIYHSPKKRAVKTAEIIAEFIPVELIKVPELTEMRYGILEGLSVGEVNEKYPGLFKERAENKYYWKDGGENFEDIRNRVRDFLNKLKSEKSCSVIVAHQMPNRAILGELLNLSIDKIPFITIPNDVIYEIDLNNLEVWNIHKGIRREGLVEESTEQ